MATQGTIAKSLDQFDVLVFDVYGTLIDWETSILNALAPLLERAPPPAEDSQHHLRSRTPAHTLSLYAQTERSLQTEHPTLPYTSLLALVYVSLAAALNVEPPPTPAENAAFGCSLAHWLPFPDTPSALAVLGQHYRLVVLSNVDRGPFLTHTLPLLESAGARFSLVLTAEDVGAYKPDPRMLRTALSQIEKAFGVGKDRVLVTAQSFEHDHVPANQLGVASTWIAREGAVVGVKSVGEGESRPKYDFKFNTLEEMATARMKNFS